MVDIICPVHNAPEFLRMCVGSLYLYTDPKEFNLILVDDNSDEETKDYLAQLEAGGWAKVLHTPGQSFFTRTCNLGIHESKAPYIVLMNSDITVTKGWLEGLLSCVEEWHAGIVGCKLIGETGEIAHAGAFGWGFHYGMNEPNVSYFEEREVEWVTGALMLIRRAVIDTVGYLDDRYVHVGSDRDLCHRAKNYGFKIVYSPVTLIHWSERSKDEAASLMIEKQHKEGMW